ncbi:hypothetical protein [uncultured Paraglaciecola sp.]|uniref:hypothetical protein n=1 Tax=uncultured Paraglaciecola sp. TaxID=1765024 RepID=UPI00260DB629|nr:hypothetical protein [uncultured Paraglaciecola sp.]
MNTIQSRFIYLREYHGLSIEQFAYVWFGGVKGNKLSQAKALEKTKQPAFKTLAKLAEFYEGLNLNWLVTGAGKPFLFEPSRMVVELPEGALDRGVRKSKFTEEQDQLIRDAWPELPAIEGFAKSQVKNRACVGLGLRLSDKEIQRRRVENNKRSGRQFSGEAKLTDVEAYNARNRKRRESEMLAGDGYATFTREQDQQIKAAWPDYKSVSLPHKDSAQIYNRGILLGLPKLSDVRQA